jgi:hypothetical protein
MMEIGWAKMGDKRLLGERLGLRLGLRLRVGVRV